MGKIKSKETNIKEQPQLVVVVVVVVVVVE